jgi:hypothetical protein
MEDGMQESVDHLEQVTLSITHRPVRAPGQRTQEHDSPAEVGQAPTSGSSWGSKWEARGTRTMASGRLRHRPN